MTNKNEQPLGPASPRPSRLGKASLILGFISPAIMVLFGCALPFALLLLGDDGEWEPPHADALFGRVAPLGFFVSPIASLTGICLAVAGLLRKNCRRGSSVAGLILNVISLSVFVLICFWWLSAIEDMIAC